MRNRSVTRVALAPYIRDFLEDRVEREQALSLHTRASYADTLRLLLSFASSQCGRPPSELLLHDIDAERVLQFLEHLEGKRKNGSLTRNARLSGIRAFMRFIEFRVPAAVELVRRVRAIPFKTSRSRLVCFLTNTEWQAVVNAASPTTAIGTRNRALLLLAITGGLRASELVRLTVDDIALHRQPTVHVLGKGRRERVLPLWSEASKALVTWLRIRPSTSARELFVSAKGRPITRAALAAVVHEHARRAAAVCPSIASKRISPHVLRHTCAMIVLKATGDIRKVALWLGHAVLKSTDPYVRADPTEKLELLEHAMPLSLRRGRFRVPDDILSFLRAKAIC